MAHDSVDPRILDDVTAVIKTFERPACLDRLVRSIRRFYPRLRTIVGDDSLHPMPRTDVQYVPLPWDIGLSAGRNALVRRVETPYFLLLDDDFEFTGSTRIEKLAHVVATQDVTIAAGDCIRSKRKWGLYVKRKPGSYHGTLDLVGDHLILRPGYRSRQHGYYCCDVVVNFFSARTDHVLAMGGWDEDLKLNEHEEFFLRLKQHGRKVAYCPDVTILHWNARPAGYPPYRNRDYWQLAARKMGIRKLTRMDGQVVVFDRRQHVA